VAILRDDAETDRLRMELRESGERAEFGKARFLATVSHELRTPLNTIIGFSDMLLHDMLGPLRNDRQREYVALVRESGEHLLAIVNSILDVARIESGTYPIAPEVFRFEDAVETSAAIVSYQAKSKSIDIGVDIERPVGEIVADRRALQQILINLLSNAVKFTPQGGRVTVTAGRAAGRLTLSISDTGIGIASEDLPRLGMPFVQVLNDHTRQHEGTGLGLSVVAGPVELQSGSMTIDSAPGMGTVVTISLPLIERTRTGTVVPVTAAAGNTRKKSDATFRQSA